MTTTTSERPMTLAEVFDQEKTGAMDHILQVADAWLSDRLSTDEALNHCRDTLDNVSVFMVQS